MRARGMTHEEIACELQVSKASIASDVQYLRDQAKELSKNTLEHLTEQYQVCLVALDSIIKRHVVQYVIAYDFIMI